LLPKTAAAFWMVGTEIVRYELEHDKELRWRLRCHMILLAIHSR